MALAQGHGDMTQALAQQPGARCAAVGIAEQARAVVEAQAEQRGDIGSFDAVTDVLGAPGLQQVALLPVEALPMVGRRFEQRRQGGDQQPGDPLRLQRRRRTGRQFDDLAEQHAGAELRAEQPAGWRQIEPTAGDAAAIGRCAATAEGGGSRDEDEPTRTAAILDELGADLDGPRINAIEQPLVQALVAGIPVGQEIEMAIRFGQICADTTAQAVPKPAFIEPRGYI